MDHPLRTPWVCSASIRTLGPSTLTTPPPAPCPCLLAALQVTVGTAHHLQAVPRAVHEELKQPVYRRDPTRALHHRLVSVEKPQPGSRRPLPSAPLQFPPPPSRLELKIGREVGYPAGWHLL